MRDVQLGLPHCSDHPFWHMNADENAVGFTGDPSLYCGEQLQAVLRKPQSRVGGLVTSIFSGILTA